MSDLSFIRDRAVPRIVFDVAPVYNALCSICLLGQKQLDHISPWVDATLARITDEERETIETACEAVHYVSMTRARTINALLDGLMKVDPTVFATIEAQRLHAKAQRHELEGEIPSVAVLSRDREAFVGLVERIPGSVVPRRRVLVPFDREFLRFEPELAERLAGLPLPRRSVRL